MAENKPFIKKNFMTEHRKQIVSFASHANSVYYENKTLDEVLHEIIEAIENIPSDLNTCSKISLECDPTTYEFKAILYNKDDEAIYTSNTIDLPIESLVLSVSYDADKNTIIIEYKDGEIIEIPVSSMTSGLQEKIDLNNKLPAEFISGLARVAITGDYEDLSNKPSINGVTLIGNKTSEDLGIIPGGTNDYDDLINKPSINNIPLEGNKSLSELGIMPAGGDEFHSEDYYTKSNIQTILTDYVNNDDAAVRAGIGYDTAKDEIFVYLQKSDGNTFPLLENGQLPLSALNKLSQDKFMDGSFDSISQNIELLRENGTRKLINVSGLIQGLASESYVTNLIKDLATEDYVDTAVSGLASEGYVQEQIAPLATKTDLAAKQNKLIAGANITIDQDTNVISATGGGGGGGTEYTAVDPILISGTSLMFNRILDDTINPQNISATNRLPTNNAVTSYVAEYVNDHAGELGKTYIGDSAIVVNNTDNIISFDRIITPTITAANKSAVNTIPCNKAVVDYIDANQATWGRTYTGTDPIVINGTTISFSKAITSTITDENKSSTLIIPTNKGAVDYVEDYVNDYVTDYVADYVQQHSQDWGKTYTGSSPIVVDSTSNIISFNKNIISTITPGEEQSESNIPTSKGVTGYVSSYINDHKFDWTYTGVDPITVSGQSISINKTFINVMTGAASETPAIPSAGAVVGYVTNYVTTSIQNITPSSFSNGILTISI